VPVDTITSPRDIDALFRKGRRDRRACVTALSAPTPDGRDPQGRVVFVAGRRLGGAVMRNRCKRVLREAVRRTRAKWPGYDVALIANESTSVAPPERIDRDIVAVAERLRSR
jgi:ribonuclease P protein component